MKTPIPAYTLRAVVNGRPATPISLPTNPIAYGQMLRLDLSIPSLPDFPTWAATQFPNTNAPNAARGADSDGDGMTNEQEWQAGTNPLDRASALALISSTPPLNGQFTMHFRTVAGSSYRLMASTHLTAFATVGSIATATGPATSFTVPETDRCFYKLELVP